MLSHVQHSFRVHKPLSQHCTRIFSLTNNSSLVIHSFPSKYIGRLTGIMWSMVGLTICLQYGLVKLTVAVPDSWKVRTNETERKREISNLIYHKFLSIGMVNYSCNGYGYIQSYSLSLDKIYSNRKKIIFLKNLC